VESVGGRLAGRLGLIQPKPGHDDMTERARSIIAIDVEFHALINPWTSR